MEEIRLQVARTNYEQTPSPHDTLTHTLRQTHAHHARTQNTTHAHTGKKNTTHTRHTYVRTHSLHHTIHKMQRHRTHAKSPKQQTLLAFYVHTEALSKQANFCQKKCKHKYFDSLQASGLFFLKVSLLSGSHITGALMPVTE